MDRKNHHLSKRIAALALAICAAACLASCTRTGLRIESVSADGVMIVSDADGNRYEYGYAAKTVGEEEKNEVTEKTYSFDLLDFGAVGDGETDDTAALKSAVEALCESGGTLYIPSGTYLVTENIRITSGNVSLRGDKGASKIVFRREQRQTDEIPGASLFTIMGRPSGVDIRDLVLTYEGTFFGEEGQSYSGKVSGICINTGSDITISGVEAYGFNHDGIFIDGHRESYVKRVTVTDCNLHHNRVSGILYGYVDGLTISGCSLCFNGAEKDGGTGYGCAASSAAEAKNVLVIGNIADNNYRKGLDVHAGERIVIDGNTCRGNRLYGIYAEGVKTSDITVTNNIVSDMPSSPLPNGYTAVYGISVGTYQNPGRGEYHNFTVSNNVIRDFSPEAGVILPLYAYCSDTEGFMKFSGNIVDTSVADYAIVMNRSKYASNTDFSVDISSNDIRIGELRLGFPMIFCGKRLSFTDNIISIGSCGTDLLITYVPSATGSEVICADNVVNIDKGSEKARFFSYASAKTYMSRGNFYNGNPVR